MISSDLTQMMTKIQNQRAGMLAIGALLLFAPWLTASAETPLNAVPVCYDFGCKTFVTVDISDDEFSQAAGWLSQPAPDALTERENLAKAIGWMEVLVGQRTPTKNDIAGNLGDGNEGPGQLDCIDESRNTTTYMKLFEARGLLKFHKVVERAFRRAIFDVHWSGQVEEVASGSRYVLDSWFQDNGNLPYIQTTEEWLDIPFWFTSYYDNGTKPEQ